MKEDCMIEKKTETEGAMKKLGEVLRFHRDERRLSTRRVADMCGVPQKDVENWEAGITVIDNKAWGKFRGIVHRRIGEYVALRQRASVEAEEMRLREAAKPKFGTSLGEKLSEKLVSIEETPKVEAPKVEAPKVEAQTPPEPKSPEPERPALSLVREPDIAPVAPKRKKRVHMTASATEREQWARLVLRQRPRMPINGPDGLLTLMRRRFGIGMDHYIAARLKDEILAEFGSMLPDVPPGVKAAPAPTPAQAETLIPVEVIRAQVEQADQLNEDIETAVQLIIDSVPELKTFTIKIDDRGEAHVEYEIKKVRVETVGGSMTVKPGGKR
jgi:hypothetical protein